ncbi:hypothetical protein MRS44_018091 [Fusarium solani]|uniref:uncharacterized protein n=1 Tax=Fusarium solani TaxID=169388 RepID=UPI0032C4A09D|nr:hypothetical protein MRS44_018091 [Fusarium solani]
MAELDIPTEQWAQVVEAPGGSVTYKRVPVHTPGPDEVLVNIRFSGVCHTDLHAMMGDWPLERKMPLIGGHEGAGIVVAKGGLVSNIDVGDHVGIKWLNGSCLNCDFCLQGDEPLCPKALLSGYTVDGTFQQYGIAKAAHATRIPPECSLEEAAPILCAGLTVYKSLKEAGLRPGQSLGASATVDFKASSDVARDVRAAVPGRFGPHAVLVLATHEQPFQEAHSYVRSHGSVVCIGMPAQGLLKAPIFDTVVRMVNIRGSYVGNRQDAAEAIEFFRLGLIKAPHKLVGLSQLQEVYAMMLKDEVAGRYVVDTNK